MRVARWIAAVLLSGAVCAAPAARAQGDAAPVGQFELPPLGGLARTETDGSVGGAGMFAAAPAPSPGGSSLQFTLTPSALAVDVLPITPGLGAALGPRGCPSSTEVALGGGAGLSSAERALVAAQCALRTGDYAMALTELASAAQAGSAAALWQLGQMYWSGEVVPRDLVRAYEYFTPLVELSFAGPAAALGRDAPYIAAALIGLGDILITGIPNRLAPQPNLGLAYQARAAMSYADPESQFRYGMTLLSGVAGQGDVAAAGAQWLQQAAKRGHALAAATIGEMLFFGLGLAAEPREGLKWLIVARRIVPPTHPDAARIWALEERAHSLASDADWDIARAAADQVLAEWVQSGRVAAVW